MDRRKMSVVVWMRGIGGVGRRRTTWKGGWAPNRKTRDGFQEKQTDDYTKVARPPAFLRFQTLALQFLCISSPFPAWRADGLVLGDGSGVRLRQALQTDSRPAAYVIWQTCRAVGLRYRVRCTVDCVLYKYYT